MGSCDYCGTTILFGGVRSGDLRFCNAQCAGHGRWLEAATMVPPDLLSEHVKRARAGDCPRCKGPGPIDVHTSYTVWSALVVTSWGSRPKVCCQACGTKSKIGAALFSGLLGWWGFPFGLIITPVQVARNLKGLMSWPDPTRPSPQFERIIASNLAAQLAGRQP